MLGTRSASLFAVVLISVLATLTVVGAPSASAATGSAHQWEGAQFTIEPLSGPLVVNGSAYRGRFHIRLDGGVVRLVNEVNVEDYMRGIREMPPSWPLEAQRAQAIAARSYALHKAVVARQEGRPWDLCATASCQVYGGITAEQHGGATWGRAVESTASEVLAYRGAPILAMYSSSNGGHTVSASKPYLRAVPDPDDAASPHHRWRVEVPEAAVGAAVELPEGAELTGLERNGGMVVARWAGPGPDAAGTARPIPVAEFRNRLEAAQPPPPGLPRLLPSTAFGLAASSEPGHVVIEGRGWGHGVGMSQHGALGKARRGMDARRILASYYAGLTPVKPGEGQVPDAIRVQLDNGGALDFGGQSAFRVAADGVGVATGTGTQGWKIGVREGRLVLTAPKGWQPAQPASPPVGPDPFEAAAASAAPRPGVAAVSTTRSFTSATAWSSAALLLLLTVGASTLLAGTSKLLSVRTCTFRVRSGTFRLRDRPDPVLFPRG